MFSSTVIGFCNWLNGLKISYLDWIWKYLQDNLIKRIEIQYFQILNFLKFHFFFLWVWKYLILVRIQLERCSNLVKSNQKNLRGLRPRKTPSKSLGGEGGGEGAAGAGAGGWSREDQKLVAPMSEEEQWCNFCKVL